MQQKSPVSSQHTNSQSEQDSALSLSALQYDSEFVDRHIGPDADENTRMLEALQID